jgi:thymidine phosphorylase
MLALANVKAEKSEILAKLNSGIAREKFAQMVASQGGRLTELPVAPARGPLLAGSSGFVNWDAKGVGMVARTLTGWRQEHPASGVEIIAKRGYAVSEGDLVAMIHAQNSAQLAWAKEALAGCLTLSCQAPEPIALLF